MKVSGFTIIRNAVINDYPIVEAIRSILPLVDEMIILVGDSEDDTLGLMQSINDPKIKIHHSVWDPNLREGGAVLAVETNKAFDLIDPESTWAVYIQGDEAIHEQYHATIRKACEQYQYNNRVQGLVFKYLHFYGTFDYVGDSRKWYDHEVRVIRNDKKIRAYKDAQGFRVGAAKLWVKPVDAYVYHYGWVRSPEQMMKKIKNFSKLWHPDAALEDMMRSPDFWDYDAFDSLQPFTGTHPAVMQERIAKQNWQVQLDISRKQFSLKDKLLYYFEKLTGIRPFDFKNYRIVRN